MRKPRLDGVAKVRHARADGTIDGATELNTVQRRDLLGDGFARSRNAANEPRSGSRKSGAEMFGWSEGNDDAEERALIRAENEALGPCRDEFRIPVAEAGTRRSIRGHLAAKLLQKRSCAPECDQPTVRGEMDVI